MTFQEWLGTRRPGSNLRGDLIQEFREQGIDSEEAWEAYRPSKEEYKQARGKAKELARERLSVASALFKDYYEWCLKNGVGVYTEDEALRVCTSICLEESGRPESDTFRIAELPERSGIPFARFNFIMKHGLSKDMFDSVRDYVARKHPDKFVLVGFVHRDTGERRTRLATLEAARRLGV